MRGSAQAKQQLEGLRLLEQIGVPVVVAARGQDLAGQAQLGELVDRPPLAGPGEERRGLDDQADPGGGVARTRARGAV